MKKPLITLLFLIFTTGLFAQVNVKVARLVKEGMNLNDSDEYEAALVKFDSALLLDKDNLEAIIGETSALAGRGEYYKTLDLCKEALKKFKHNAGLKEVYINYADALNNVRKYDECAKICDKAIELYPNDFRIYFCKAACLSNNNKDEESIPYYEKVITYDSGYSRAIALSDFTIGRVMYTKDKHVQSVLALCKFVAEDPKSSRAKWAMEMILQQMAGTVKKNKDGGMIIYIDKASLGEDSKGKKTKDNNFSNTSLLLSTMAITNGLDTLLHQNVPESFMRKFKVICSSLRDGKDSGTGFYWNYYGAFFVDMYNKDYLETFSNVAYLSMDDADAKAWVKENKQKCIDLYKWSHSFAWKR